MIAVLSRLSTMLMISVLISPWCAKATPPDLETLSGGIWIDRQYLQSLPTEGPAWDRLLVDAARSTDAPNLSDQEDMTNVWVFAKALAHVRTGEASYRDQVISACMAAMGTEDGGSSLALGRELMAYVLAADLVGLPPEEDAAFRAWLAAVMDKVMSDGRTLRTTHAQRSNNWGTHAGASRLAAAAYLGDAAEIDQVAAIFKGWLGDRSSYAGFKYGALDWQADPNNPVGINPFGSVREGHSIDGVLPEEQRRSSGFTWPPPQENYVYEGLQGALAQAVILQRAGYPAFEWENQALRRAFQWLHDQANYPAEGDDTWQPYLINLIYRTNFPVIAPSRPGKNVGYTDWSHSPLPAPRNLRVGEP